VKRVKTKYKKLLLELEFLYSDLDYHNDVQEEAMREFHKAFGAYCKENNINYESDLIKEEERKIQVSDPDKVTFRDEDGNPTRGDSEDIKEIENSSRPDEIRKLFKQIATKTHPDKFSNAKKAEKSLNMQVFLQAKKAAEENNYFKLQQIAQRLGLELPQMTQKQVKLMEEEAKRLRNTLKKMEKTLVWVWFEQNTAEKRQIIMQRYVTDLLRNKN